MSAIERYRLELRGQTDRRAFLLAHANLPGPRANLELAQAAADECDPECLRAFAALTPEAAPQNTALEFLAFCGVLGLGRLDVGGDPEAIPELRGHAADPRWRTREAVAMALQRVGDDDIGRLLAIAEEWSLGTAFERRAAAAAVCEPRLLRQPAVVARVLALLDGITRFIAAAEAGERRTDGFRALRQAMGYCWSVAVAAGPEAGKKVLAFWLAAEDPDVRWLLRENLWKKRLLRLDPAWVEACLRRLTPG